MNGLVAPPHARYWTVAGACIALLALPLAANAFRWQFGAPLTVAAYVGREAMFFALLGVLLWIVRRGEALPLASLGLITGSPGRSLLRGVIGAVLCAVGLAVGLGLVSLLGLHFGGNGKPHFTPPAWAMLITVVRASVVEEVFYRGYAIDRLHRLTGNKAIAVVLPLLVLPAPTFGRAPVACS